ncbi:MAG: RHS repeat-associated core domain-containing protein, partial [Pirellula sp.]
YNYDSKGNLLETVYPDGSIERLSSYTPSGLPGVSTNRRGQPLSYTYNALGQVTKQTFADSSFITFAYDTRGNLTTVTDGAEITTYTYNLGTDGDRLKRITYPNGRYLDYTYDSFGRRTQMVDQDGFATKYEYDTAGRLYRLRDSADTILVTYTYDTAGRLSRIDKGNGTFTTYEYDPAGQILSLKNWRNATALNSKFDYTYDSRGRRISMTTLDGSWTYGYDGTGQLTRAIFASLNTANIPNQNLQYFYDAVGNRTKTILNGVTTLYTINNLNQYASVGGVGQTYDADGNLTFDGAVGYVFDQQNRLIQVVGPEGVTVYVYDTFGNRTSRIVNGSRTESIVDIASVGEIAAVFDSSSVRISQYFHGLGLSAVRQTDENIYTFDFDGNGNVVGIRNGMGGVVTSSAYDPFGSSIHVTNGIQNKFRFSGQFGVTSELNNVVLMGARSYSPLLGRFNAVDPVQLFGDDPNWYRFTSNAPTNFVDPFGLWKIPTTLPGYLSTTGKVKKGSNMIEMTGEGASKRCIEVIGTYGAIQGATAGALAGSIAFSRAGLLLGVMTANPIIGIAGYFGGKIIGGIVGGYFGGSFGNDFAENEARKSGLCTPQPRSEDQPPPGGGIGGSGANAVSNAVDPNEKRAGAGFGTLSFVASSSAIPYRIEFENYGPGSVETDGTPAPASRWATAPAQNVTISDMLSTNFDWSTFRLTEVGFGDTRISIPANSQSFRTTRTITYNGKTFAVAIEIGLRAATGEVFAIFQSLDPATELPPDVLTGFLPPEDGTGRGKGYFTYTIQPKAGLATGTEIRNVALISFDSQLFIATDQVDPLDPSLGVDSNRQARITIDAGLPTSNVASLPAITSTANFAIQWNGADDSGGAGIAGYDLYVSTNGSAYSRFLSNTSLITTTYSGTLGSTYRFYSVAIDNTGQRQLTPTSAHSTTRVAGPPTDITLTPNTVLENSLAGTIVGTLGAIDPDNDETYSYALVNGIGSTDNALFAIANGQLQTAAVFDFETKNNYSIRVQVQDSRGFTFERSLSVLVANANEAPTSIPGSPYQAVEGVAIVLNGTGTDPDVGSTLSYAWDLQYDGVQFDVDFVGANPSVSFPDNGVRTIALRVTDSGSPPLSSISQTTVSIANAPPNLTRSQSSVSGVAFTTVKNTGTWSDVAGDGVQLTASIGSVSQFADGSWTWTYVPTMLISNQLVVITATDKDGGTANVDFTLYATPGVARRSVWYAGSSYDSLFGVEGSLDSIRVLAKSSPVTQSLSKANVVNSSMGINGIVFDVAGLATQSLSISDFVFRMAPSGVSGVVTPSEWPFAPAPTQIAVTAGTASSPARVRLRWADNAIQNTWLQVMVLANGNTGLATREVYYVGHALGDINQDSPYRVTAGDLSLVQSVISNTIISVDDLRDITKDRRVTAADLSFVQSRISNQVLLQNIIIPAADSSAEGGSGGLQRMASVLPSKNDKEQGTGTIDTKTLEDKLHKLDSIHANSWVFGSLENSRLHTRIQPDNARYSRSTKRTESHEGFETIDAFFREFSNLSAEYSLKQSSPRVEFNKP